MWWLEKGVCSVNSCDGCGDRGKLGVGGGVEACSGELTALGRLTQDKSWQTLVSEGPGGLYSHFVGHIVC